MTAWSWRSWPLLRADRSAGIARMARFWPAPWVAIAMLLAAVLIVYPPTYSHDFVDLDDGVYVVENEQVREGLTVSGI